MWTVEEQLDRFSIVAAKLDELQANQASCRARIEEREAKVAGTLPSAANVPRSGNDCETVRSITREEVELEARRNNAVLSGIAEVENVSCVSLDRDILPDGVLLLDAQRHGSHVDGKSNLAIWLICKLRCTICQLSRNLSNLQIEPTNFISQHESFKCWQTAIRNPNHSHVCEYFSWKTVTGNVCFMSQFMSNIII